MATYDQIGTGYAAQRRADPRIAAPLRHALDGVRTIVNVGAGTGSYEDTRVIAAIEPSEVMLSQRIGSAAPAVQAVAEALPLPAGCADAATALLTLHHWVNRDAGLAELRRVARDRVVLFTWDSAMIREFWLVDDYLPELVEIDAPRFPSMQDYERALGPCEVVRVPIPHDCTDGVFCAHWRNPERYLDPEVRRSMSNLALLDQAMLEERVAQLRRDLDTGVWNARHGHLKALDELDLGYRVVIARVL